MTKTLIFLLVFVVTVTGMSRYSLNAEEKSVLKFSGYDWSNSSPSFKFGFVFGWLYGGKEATDYTAITAVALLRGQKRRNETDSKKFL